MEHLEGYSLSRKHYTRLEKLAREKTLAYYKKLVKYGRKKFYSSATWRIGAEVLDIFGVDLKTDLMKSCNCNICNSQTLVIMLQSHLMGIMGSFHPENNGAMTFIITTLSINVI